MCLCNKTRGEFLGTIFIAFLDDLEDKNFFPGGGAERKIFETKMNDDFAPTKFSFPSDTPPLKNLTITYDLMNSG